MSPRTRRLPTYAIDTDGLCWPPSRCPPLVASPTGYVYFDESQIFCEHWSYLPMLDEWVWTNLRRLPRQDSYEEEQVFDNEPRFEEPPVVVSQQNCPKFTSSKQLDGITSACVLLETLTKSHGFRVSLSPSSKDGALVAQGLVDGDYGFWIPVEKVLRSTNLLDVISEYIEFGPYHRVRSDYAPVRFACDKRCKLVACHSALNDSGNWDGESRLFIRTGFDFVPTWQECRQLKLWQVRSSCEIHARSGTLTTEICFRQQLRRMFYEKPSRPYLRGPCYYPPPPPPNVFLTIDAPLPKKMDFQPVCEDKIECRSLSDLFLRKNLPGTSVHRLIVEKWIGWTKVWVIPVESALLDVLCQPPLRRCLRYFVSL